MGISMQPTQGSMPKNGELCFTDREMIEDEFPILSSLCQSPGSVECIQTYNRIFSSQAGVLSRLTTLVLCTADPSTLIFT